jgi:DNA invertase Pin-like site-specific DNA recombinase
MTRRNTLAVEKGKLGDRNRAIVERLAAGASTRAVATEFGLTPTQIGRIRMRVTGLRQRPAYAPWSAERVARLRLLPSTQRQPAVFGYVRVSTDTQADNGVSLDEQQRRIEGRCLEQGWHLAEIFVERGVSGSVPFAERPEGGRLLRQLQAGDIVISPKLDRVFRSSLERVRIGERIRDARAHMRRQGRHLGGSRPFGYRLGVVATKAISFCQRI